MKVIASIVLIILVPILPSFGERLHEVILSDFKILEEIIGDTPYFFRDNYESTPAPTSLSVVNPGFGYLKSEKPYFQIFSYARHNNLTCEELVKEIWQAQRWDLLPILGSCTVLEALPDCLNNAKEAEILNNIIPVILSESSHDIFQVHENKQMNVFRLITCGEIGKVLWKSPSIANVIKKLHINPHIPKDTKLKIFSAFLHHADTECWSHDCITKIHNDRAFWTTQAADIFRIYWRKIPSTIPFILSAQIPLSHPSFPAGSELESHQLVSFVWAETNAVVNEIFVGSTNALGLTISNLKLTESVFKTRKSDPYTRLGWTKKNVLLIAWKGNQVHWDERTEKDMFLDFHTDGAEPSEGQEFARFLSIKNKVELKLVHRFMAHRIIGPYLFVERHRESIRQK